ncbi:MAG: hypothetical protein PHC62_07150 [Candidatus Izemoplasmatales bacterium]|nr:hypothetical protein [Candidatus Izemoplasmatales bacterium]
MIMKKKQTYILFDFGFPNDATTYYNKTYKIKGDIINKLLSIIAVNYIHRKPNPQGYLEIPAAVFKRTYSNYAPYIHYLITNNIIECDNYFVYKHQDQVSHPTLYELLNRNKCMGYRFSYDFSRNANVVKTIYYKKLFDENTKKSPKKKAQKQSISPVEIPQVSIHPDTFNRLKRDFRSATIRTLVPRKINLEESAYIDLSRWFRNIVQLHKWKNVSSTFKLKSNRIYNNFTFLSSHVRKECITLSGEELCELDIHNSFPVMLAVYAFQQNPELKNDADFKRYCSWIKSGRFYDLLKDKLNEYIDSDTSSREKKYQKQLEKAQKHYEETGEKLKIKDFRDIPKRKLSRKAVKELFQIYLNGDKKRSPLLKGYGDTFIRKQIKQYFPCINEIVSYDMANKSMIYYILSKIETEFIIGIITETYSNYPQIRLLVVHDSIYFPSSYSEETQEIWYRHLNNLYNLLPDDEDSEATIRMCAEIEDFFENDDENDYFQDDEEWDFFNEGEDDDDF